MYDKYAGRRAEWAGFSGIVCGYGDDKMMDLIIAVDESERGVDSWHVDQCGGTFITHLKNKMGYLYLYERNIID